MSTCTDALKGKKDETEGKVWQYHLKLLYKLHLNKIFRQNTLWQMWNEGKMREEKHDYGATLYTWKYFTSDQETAWRFDKWSQGSNCMGNVGKKYFGSWFLHCIRNGWILVCIYVQLSTWILLSCNFPELKDFYQCDSHEKRNLFMKYCMCTTNGRIPELRTNFWEESMKT